MAHLLVLNKALKYKNNNKSKFCSLRCFDQDIKLLTVTQRYGKLLDSILIFINSLLDYYTAGKSTYKFPQEKQCATA